MPAPCNAKIVTGGVLDSSESPNGNGLGWLAVPNNGGALRNALRVPVTTSGSSDYFIGAIGDCDVLFNTKLSGGVEVIPYSTTGEAGAEDVQALVTHELGHFKLHHVIRRMAWTFVVSLGFLALLGYLKDKAWFYQGLGVSWPASDAMALILFMLAVPVFTFLLHPLVAMYSRKHEFEADAYAARYSSAPKLVDAETH